MRIPLYLLSLSPAVVFANHSVENSSPFLLGLNQFTLKGTHQETIYVVLADPDLDRLLPFVFEKNTQAKIVFIGHRIAAKRLEFDFLIKQNANVEIIFVTALAKSKPFALTRRFRLLEASHLQSHFGLFTSTNVEVEDVFFLNGVQASLNERSVIIGDDASSIIFKQTVHHDSPDASSLLDNYLIAKAESKLEAIVTGSIAKGNHGSSCIQNSRGLLFGEMSSIRVDPKLLIDEYDVEARHGAAIGQINENELFYLLSRGIPEDEAKRLIVSGYTDPFLASLEPSLLVKVYDKLLRNMMKGAAST